MGYGSGVRPLDGGKGKKPAPVEQPAPTDEPTPPTETKD